MLQHSREALSAASSKGKSKELAYSSNGLADHFGLRTEIDNFETQWIPAARFRILCRFGVGVLNGCDPVRKGFLGTRTLTGRLEIAHLSEIRQPARAREETDRIDLHSHAAAIFVHVQRRIWISRSPQGIP